MAPKRWALVWAAIAALVGAALIVTTPAARADCESVSVWVDREQAPTTYVVGPSYCATPTPWGEEAHVTKDEQVGGVGPVGSPSGAGASVTVTGP
jgi:hypothetical protein